MLERIALILDMLPFVGLFLWVVGNISHIIPRAMAKRIARMEDEWEKNTVETDRLGLLTILVPAFLLAIPGLVRLVMGIPTAMSNWMLVLSAIFTAFVLLTNCKPCLRYDDAGIYIRGGNGKVWFLPWHQITDVQWQMGASLTGRINRSRPLTPVVAIYYSSDLFGKPITDVYYLNPSTERGISRFMAAWDARHPKESYQA